MMMESGDEMQREKERERRRVRDRERRQNMSHEQRERHLARRRKNYQLRRWRSQHSHLLPSPSPQPHSPSFSNPLPRRHSLFFPPSSTTPESKGAQQVLPSFLTRLRLSDIRHLARRLHNNDMHQDGDKVVTTSTHSSPTNCLSTNKRLRLLHVKRLARSIKVNAKQVAT